MNGGDITRAELDKVWGHIETINHELGVVCKTQANIKTDVCWLKKFQWLILTTAMGGVILALIRLATGI